MFLVRPRARLGFLSSIRERQRFDQRVRGLAIREAGWARGVHELSGGNQQKVLLARWLENEPRILLLDEPTRGIDVGTKEEIYDLIDTLAAAGLALLVVTSEIPELLRVSDRIMVLREGRVVAETPAATTTEEALLRLMTGAQPTEPPRCR
jgi:ABC-type sugar transport system ATPase subunit